MYMYSKLLAVALAAASNCGGSCAPQQHTPPPNSPPSSPPGLLLVPPPTKPGYTLAWHDEFDGAKGLPPNPKSWTVLDNQTHGGLEQQLYVRDAVALDGNGHVDLTTARLQANVTGPDGKSQYAFSSGWLDTTGKVEIAFGRWEIRAKLPDPEARGIWPAHWLMPTYTHGGANDWNCWPIGVEIDIMEATGGIYNNTVLGTYHWGANCSAGTPPPSPGPAAPNCTCGCGCDLHKLSKFGGQFECTHPDGNKYQCEKAHDFHSDFHVFAVEWEAEAIRWYVDDKLYWTRTLGVDHVSFIPSQPDYIILNTAIQPAMWNKGAGTEGTYPVTHTIDYVRVWHKDAAAPPLAYPGPLDFNCTTPPLSVVYGAPLGTKVVKTNPGLAHEPAVTFAAARADAGYTLMMIDAGGTAGPQAVYPVRHWLVVNIPGVELAKGNISGGVVGEKFHSPGPPKGSHYHRYAQFVFEQPEPTVDFSTGANANFTIPFHTDIVSWNYSIFIEQYHLGAKLASNYILCEAPGG